MTVSLEIEQHRRHGGWGLQRALRVPAMVLGAVLFFAFRSHAQFNYELTLPGMCVSSDGQTSIRLYLPPSCQEHVRGILIIPQNTNNLHVAKHNAMRNLAGSEQLGILYLRCGILTGKVAGGDDIDTAKLAVILDTLAKVTKVPDLRHAPWLPFGLSSVGRVPFFLIWKNPERCIAGVTWHGEVPPYPPSSWARITDATMPYLCAVGQKEWIDAKIAPEGHWKAFVRPGLLMWRAQGWLTDMVVGKNVGHLEYPGPVTEYMMLDYMTLFVKGAVQARLPPKGEYATTGPIALKQIDPSSGYLINPDVEALLFNRTTRPDTMIHPYADVPEDKRESMMWTFNRETAVAWINFHLFPNVLAAKAPFFVPGVPRGAHRFTGSELTVRYGGVSAAVSDVGAQRYSLAGKPIPGATSEDGRARLSASGVYLVRSTGNGRCR